ncbi:calcium-binding protein [Pseudonocardia nantongensis]|uniref:calcium-binding protein n=1 Tax=Pseudonocardia nantongensis TaxID=1181885 RepID=UPI00397CB0E1
MNQPRPLARRAGTVTATLVLAALAGVPLAGAASAAPAQDVDCPALTRSAAQAILDADPSDPNRLDRDGDGLACEDSDLAPSGGTAPAEPSEDRAAASPSEDRVTADPSGSQVSVVPSGGVAAGDGSGGPDGPADAGTFLLVGAGAVVAAGAGAAVRAGRRAGRPDPVRG